MRYPLVSCLVTAHDQGRFLERAIESALAPDYPALEVVIVDDGSTDDTAAVADALAGKHENVRVVHQAYGGSISAFNRAISEARGDLYAILDADDTWLPGKLRKQVDLLEARPELGLVYSDLAVTDEHDTVVKPSFWAEENVHALDGRCAAGLVTVGNTAKASSIVVRASLRDAFFPLPDDVPYCDWWVAFRTACVAPIGFVDEPLVGYRRHGAGLTLDVQGDALARELRKEHQFRRVALARLEPGVLTVAESVRAYGALEASAHVVRSAADTAFASLAAPRPAEAEAELALADASAPLAALRHRLRAVALDPWNDEARAAFVATAQELAEEPHAREEVLPETADGFLALGFLDELVDAPDMLTDYVHAFDGNRDARLVLLAPGQDPGELGTALEPIAQALGLDREDSAEVVVVTSEGAGEELAQQAAAVYTRQYRNSYLSDVPQVGAIEELVRMARQPQPQPQPVAAAAAAVAEPDVIAIGFLEEIAAAPELLEDFARTYDGRRDTRLVLLAPEFAGSEDELSRALEGFAAAMGLDREESADVVVLTDPGAEAELAPRARALYTRVERGGSLAHLPRVADADALLRLSPRGPERAEGTFACNVCSSQAVAGEISREAAVCSTCGSTARFRSVVRALSLGLFGEDLDLRDFPERRDLRGVGMTDWEGYAKTLEERFDFTNTYLHRQPYLDITDPDPALAGTLDFVLSSEVFEHVAPPVVNGFANVRRLLKPGGVFVLTVPWVPDGETREHFPNLHDYEIVQRGGERVLLNTTATGEREEFRDLCFHGGDGETLELRLFARDSLVRDLLAAGFERVEVLDRPEPGRGVDWEPACSFPVLAWAPEAEQKEDLDYVVHAQAWHERAAEHPERHASSPEAVELLSIHVPKTAGTAFTGALIDVYGAENVLFDDGSLDPAAHWPSDRWPRVVTGHFALKRYERLCPNARAVTWLRDPADRLVSAYFFWKECDRTENPLQMAVQDGELSLLELAELFECRDVVRTYHLHGFALEDLDFVGVQEHFHEDFDELCVRLGWRRPTLRRARETKSEEYRRFRLDEATRKQLHALNPADTELYRKALELRARRLGRAA